MFIVRYREHGELNIDTKHYGPFDNERDAYEYLCSLPALGHNDTGQQSGEKWIVELVKP